MCAGIAIFLGQAKIDDIHQVTLLAQTHQEVVWLHISVDEVLGVDVFNAADLQAGAEHKCCDDTLHINKLEIKFQWVKFRFKSN